MPDETDEIRQQLLLAEWLPKAKAMLYAEMSNTTFYTALNAGRFKARKNGTILQVHMPSYRAFHDGLPEYQPGHQPVSLATAAKKPKKPKKKDRSRGRVPAPSVAADAELAA